MTGREALLSAQRSDPVMETGAARCWSHGKIHWLHGLAPESLCGVGLVQTANQAAFRDGLLPRLQLPHRRVAQRSQTSTWPKSRCSQQQQKHT